MKVRFFVLISVVLVASGCSQSLPDDASEGFDQLVENRDDSNYHVVYDLSIKSEEVQGASTKIDYYSYDGITKIVGESIDSYSSAVNAVYYLDNRTVSCTDSSGIVSCSSGSSKDMFDLAFNAKFGNLNYSGTDSFAGRECENFDGVPNTSSVNPSEYESLNSEVCLDRKLGFPAYMEINASTEYSDATVTLEATKFDRDADERNVELPKELTVSVSCYSNPSITLTPLKPLDSATVSFNNYNRSLDLGERFESKEFDLNETRLSSGSTDLQINAGDYSKEESCYYYDYSSSDDPDTEIGDDYDYDYDTDYNYSTNYSYSYGEAETSNTDLSQYSIIDRRISNSEFENIDSDKGFSIGDWSHTDGNTHEISDKNLLDGSSVGTSWESNALDVDPASVSQEVDLTGVKAIGIDVAGGGGNPQRSKIILEVDGEQEGEFIESPQQDEEYLDLGVELDQNYEGVHTVKIKWVHVTGDNLGGSAIDNVKAYS